MSEKVRYVRKNPSFYSPPPSFLLSSFPVRSAQRLVFSPPSREVGNSSSLFPPPSPPHPPPFLPISLKEDFVFAHVERREGEQGRGKGLSLE